MRSAILMVLLGCGPGATESAGQLPPRAPVSLFRYDVTAALDLRSEAITSPAATISLFAVSYASPDGGRVTGQLAVPTTPGPHAGVIVLHGLPGDAASAMRVQGLALAERGTVALAIDAPWVRRGALPDFTPRDSADQVQLMKDLQRAVDVLVARRDVDASRIGYVGGSYGGAMGALFVGLERRLRAAVLFVPDGGLVAHLTDAHGAPIGPLAELEAGARERWLAAMRPIEPIRFIAEAAPTALLFQNGRSDPFVAVEDAEALHRAAREPKEVRWYDAGHGLTTAARSERLEWIVERLRPQAGSGDVSSGGTNGPHHRPQVEVTAPRS